MKNHLLSTLVFILLAMNGNSQCTLNLSTTCFCKSGADSCDLLPDITVSRPNLLINGNNGYVEYPPVCNPPCSGNDGRLRISVSTPNIGHGPMETRGSTVISATTQMINQRIYHKSIDDTMRFNDYPAGTMTYHPSHGHQHVDNWGIYTLRTQTSNPDPLTWPIIGTGSKLAFCLLDIGSCNGNPGYCVDSAGTILNSTNFENYGLGGGSYGCSNTVQGISAGFLDTYTQSLDGMWINLPSGLCNGQYWIVVQIDHLNLFREENDNNNVMAVPITLTQQSGAVPTVTASGPTSFCSGGSVTLTCATAQNYLWSNGATTKSIIVNTSGNYSVTVNTATACASTSPSTTVTVNPFNVVASATTAANCPGDPVQLNATAPSTGTINVSTPFTNNTVVGIPDNNPTGASSSITVSGINPLTLSPTSIVSVNLNLTHTYNGDLLIQLIAPSGNTINLSNRRGGSGDNFVNTLFSASASTSIASGVAPFTGSYLPDGAFSALTGNANGTWTLKVIDQANVDVGTINDWTLNINNSVATTLSYTWSSSPAGFVSNSQNPVVNPNATTTYTVNVIENGTGCSGSQSTIVNVGGNLNVTTNSPAPICEGSSTILTASGGSNYSWSPAIGLNATTGTSVTANPVITTVYRVIGNSNGCTDTAFVTVTVTPLPAISINSPAAICAGTSTELIAAGASTYSWSPSLGLNTIAGDTVNASPSTTTTYTVTGNLNNCSATLSVLVTVNPIPTITLNADNNSVCDGQQSTLTANGASTYTWSPVNTLNTATGTVVIATPINATQYTVIGTSNNCSNQATITINVNSAPVFNLPVSGASSLCAPFNQSYSATNITGAQSYNWFTPSGVTVVSGQGTNTISVAGSTSVNGDICISAYNSCGSSISCINIQTNVSIPTIPNSISGSKNACPGNTATYSVMPVANATYYQWTFPAGVNLLSGAGTNVINVNFVNGFSGGLISVAAGNGCGIGAFRNKTVSLNNPGTPVSINGPSYGVCNSLQQYAVTAVAGYTYNWTVPAGCTVFGNPNPDSNVVFIYFDPTFYSGNVSVQSVNSCGVSSLRTKIVRAYPQAPALITGLTNVCAGQSGVSYQIATLPFANSYLWTAPSGGTITSGQGTKNITVNFGSATGLRNIYVRGQNDCGNGSTKALAVNVSTCPKLSDDSDIEENVLSIYPNPASNYIEVLFNSDNNEEAMLTLSDVLGKTIYSQNIFPDNGSNSYYVNLKNFPSGMYLVCLTFENNKITKRLIIE